MSFIRILLADISFEVREVVSTAIEGHADLVLAREVSGEVDLLLGAARADVVVMVWDGSERVLAATERLLDEYPDIGIVAIDVTCDRALMYHRVPQIVSLGPVSSESVVTAIRKAAINDPAAALVNIKNHNTTRDGEPS